MAKKRQSKSQKKWYVIHVLSGHENRVKFYLEKAIALHGFENKIGRILIPTEEVVKLKHGKRVTSQRKFFPSYILIEMEMTQETRHLVTNIPGVTHFVGAGLEPQELREEEVDHILERVEAGAERKPTVTVSFKPGDNVKISDGPFSGFSGVIDEIDEEKGRLTVMVTIFGRATPVKLDFLQVQSI